MIQIGAHAPYSLPGIVLFLTSLGVMASCSGTPDEPLASENRMTDERTDKHSYSEPNRYLTTNLELDLTADFDRRALTGSVTLSLKPGPEAAGELVLDTRSLKIDRVEASSGGDFKDAKFAVGDLDKHLGAPLRITVPEGVSKVRVTYQTAPGASGLQWLTPEQTQGKKHPFLFSQSQAIHVRSWIPLQDTPGVRATYSATIRTPKDLVAVMSAEMENTPSKGVERTGAYRFDMPQPIPSYLIALAVGDLEFVPMSERTGIYAEPAMAARAAKEFEDTEAMMQATERLYGPYRWGRYDLLVLPPSFPFGGMENPRLTFATPTVVTGDKSLVSLVAHELAHSWSGNLVTNATWRDFWLNEGFTVYIENRIQEEVFGTSRANMEAALEYEELLQELKDLEARNQVLRIDLDGRDPDEGFSLVPYIKGMLLLRAIEREVGREEFDRFLKAYFDHFSFQSITTKEFVEYLNEKLSASHQDLARNVGLDDWLNDPGLPPNAPRLVSDRFTVVEAAAKVWSDGGPLPDAGVSEEWTTQEWLRFLRTLPRELTTAKMDALDRAFRLTWSPNAEIAHQWLIMAVRNEYQPAYSRLEKFLTTVGRRKFVKPLFEELAKTPAGLARAEVLYDKAKSGYHPITAKTVEELLAKARARS